MIDFDTARDDLEIWLEGFGAGPRPTKEDIDEFKRLVGNLLKSLEADNGSD
ncbi:hypothetical protein [Lentilactobacillus parafarraginis]|uniref:Uncharacterized protein n=1 Tax=Lentilactobacillus parafarraginis DSM 18390 = JCM 14109 TaxID=1423786 RepID=A0A0R1YED5_9LACO|nr:hypothetical protein [Lentilactobacillus parafarraginis]KRM40682.1 hypothetical protein FD47_GL002702 [Lentilactobacillus parafarraginis DSM 18390 = JCM 14109]